VRRAAQPGASEGDLALRRLRAADGAEDQQEDPEREEPVDDAGRLEGEGAGSPEHEGGEAGDGQEIHDWAGREGSD